MGLSNEIFVLGDSAVLTVLGQVSFMPVLVLAARLCPEVCPAAPRLSNHVDSVIARSRRCVGSTAVASQAHAAASRPSPWLTWVRLKHASASKRGVNHKLLSAHSTAHEGTLMMVYGCL